MNPATVRARYWIETPDDPRRAAEAMAGEQSSGTFVAVPGETDALRARHGARVEQIVDLGTTDTPSLPGARRPRDGRWRRAEVVIDFPVGNIGDSLVNLVTLVAGNLFELGHLSGVRLLDFTVPQAFSDAQPGPAFGMAGTRRLSNVHGRPLLGTIIKPSVGLTPDETAALVDTLLGAGLDFIKDDELIAGPPYSTVEKRAAAVLPVVERHAQRTGRRALYAFNISGTVEEMRRRHDAVLRLGGTCVMVSLLTVGLAGLLELRRHALLPIHGHRNGWGMLDRCPALGTSYVAWQKFFRFAGADHLHVNGLRNKFCEDDASVIASARACQTPIHGRHACVPVFSSGQTVLQVHDTFAALGNTDLLFLAGGGVLAHPDGPAAGVASLREAWDAAVAGKSLESRAAKVPALRRAIEFYARP